MAKPTQNPTQSGRMPDLFQSGRDAWELFLSNQVPLAIKAIPILAALYIISPLDFLPDVVPIAGQLDDVAILILGLKAFSMLAGRHLAASQPQPVPAPEATVTTTYRVRPG
jgi:uncharacterized membrane protein YkvA (DUF1232 family)